MITVKDIVTELQKYPETATVMLGELGEFPPGISPATEIRYTEIPVDCEGLRDLFGTDVVEIYSGYECIETDNNYTTPTVRDVFTALGSSDGMYFDRPLRAVLLKGCGGSLFDIGDITTLDDGSVAIHIGTPYQIKLAENKDCLILKTHAEAKQEMRLAELDEELDEIMSEDRR